MSGTSSLTVCPECDGSLHPDRGETVCAACGLIVSEDHLDRGPEWRAFEEVERERTGAPLTHSRHDRGLSTEIGRGSRGLSGRRRRRIARLRRQHNRARIATKADRNRVHAFTEIRRVVSALGLPTRTRESACILFARAQDADLLRGRSVEGFAAAALYAACRIGALSRTIREITAVAQASESELQAAYDAMNRDLGLPTGPVDPREFIPRFASELDLPPRVENHARDLVNDLQEAGHLDGRHPAGIAAGCLYAAATDHDYDLTQAEAADVADVTPVTLRATYQALG